LEKIADQDVTVVVPSIAQASKEKPFAKRNFVYDKTRDCYTCPEGRNLIYRFTDTSGTRIYKSEKNVCKHCPSLSLCTRIKKGRVIQRFKDEDLKEKFEALYQEPDSQQVYKLRKEKVELPFGHIKRNLKFDAFLLRGRNGAKAEISLAGACFNIARMITLFGVEGLIQKLQG